MSLDRFRYELYGSSPAILTNDNGSHRTRTEYVAGLQTITACSAPISTR